jgi:hypothetical protein
MLAIIDELHLLILSFPHLQYHLILRRPHLRHFHFSFLVVLFSTISLTICSSSLAIVTLVDRTARSVVDS